MDHIPKASHDAGAPAYDAWSIGHPTLRLKYIDYLVEQLCRDRSVAAAGQKPGQPFRPLCILELGCNTGKPVTEKLLRELEPVHMTATDMSATHIYLAKKLLGKHGEKAGAPGSWVDWVETDMMSLAFADADETTPTNPETPETPETPMTPQTNCPDTPGFDAVVACYSFIHLPRDEQALLLHRIARWLRPGGFLLANFSEEPRPSVPESWLQDTDWILWSGWGVDGISDRIRETELEFILAQVDKDDAHSSFFWVLARKPLAPPVARR